MNIKLKGIIEETIELSVVNYCEEKLEDQDSSGQLESISYEIVNTRRAFGRLMDVLATKKVITAVELTLIVDGYEATEAEYVEEDK